MGKWTRRAFITTGVLAGGAVVIGVAIRPGNRSGKVAPLIAGEDETVLNVWVKIAPDNTITAIVPHAEMGQGVHTTLAMMLAEEMDADWNTVAMMEARNTRTMRSPKVMPLAMWISPRFLWTRSMASSWRPRR